MFARVVATALAVIAALGSFQPAEAADGPTVLTIIGDIAKPNRQAFDPFPDAFLKFHDKKFDKGRTFDRASLAALPQVTVTAKAAEWPRAIKASGPRLKDVLQAAGVADTSNIMVFALDGYGAEFTGPERTAKDWVLAIDVDGAPLGIGGRGPAWLVHETGTGAVTSDEEAKWVWSAFLISTK